MSQFKEKNNETRPKLNIIEVAQIKTEYYFDNQQLKKILSQLNINSNINSKETTFSGSIREKNYTMYEDIIYSKHLKAYTNLHQLCSTPTALVAAQPAHFLKREMQG